MKFLCALFVALAAPLSAHACDPLGVCSQAVAVQSFHVASVPAVQVQTFVPTVAVQSLAVVPQTVVVQEVGHCGVVANSVRVAVKAPRAVVQSFRPPRQVVRQRSVIRSR